MKILLSWLKEFIKLDDINVENIEKTLTEIGLEVEDVKNIGINKKYFENLVVGEIIECGKHPNADRLNYTKVDIGNGVILNIICGAPNVKKGLKVVVAKDGSILKTFSGEELKIKKSKIRGEISEGMLCAEDEIGISNNHQCIIELDEKYNVGEKCYDIFKEILKEDYLITVDLTPNLSYSSSYLGISKDLGAVFKIKPNINYENYEIKKLSSDILNVNIANNEICNRFSCLLIKNVKITESPEIIKKRLQYCDIKPINNVVDLANYIMLEYGNPLHVYDFNKIGKNIKIGTTNEIEFLALNNKKYILANDITVIDDKEVLSLGGVIGGLNSAVSNDTSDILIECASYDSTYIRKTSSRLNLKTDASYRFERGIDEKNIVNVLMKYLECLKKEQQDIKIEGYIDINNCESSLQKIETSFTNINKIIGQNIDKNIVKDILERLDIIAQFNDDNITATIPSYRKNIKCQNDIVHEILRFYGYNNLRYDEINEHKMLKKQPSNQTLEIKNTFRNILCSNGFYEIRTNPLISKNEIIDKSDVVELKNPSSNYLNVLRTNLIYSGLEVIKYNINHSNKCLKLFEFGNIYKKNNNDFIELQHLAIYISGDNIVKFSTENENNDFFTLKKYVFKLLSSYNFVDLKLKESTTDLKDLIDGLDIIYKNETIGYLGKLSAKLLDNYEINQNVFFANLYFYKILELIKNCPPTIYNEISKYPIIKRDLSLILDKNVKFEDVKNVIKKVNPKINDVKLFDIYVDKNNTEKKTYSISFYIDPKDKNIENNEITDIFNKTIENCEKYLNAQIKRE